MLFLNIGPNVAHQSNHICILGTIWPGYILKTLKQEITCLQAITIYSALWVGYGVWTAGKKQSSPFSYYKAETQAVATWLYQLGSMCGLKQITAWLTLNRACIFHRLMPTFLQRAETSLYHFQYLITSHLLDAIFIGRSEMCPVHSTFSYYQLTFSSKYWKCL